MSGEDCDSWSEGESEWHFNWKDKFPAKAREVVVGNHRADVKLSSGLVIELQRSSISPEEIRERESFYGSMVWIFDVRESKDRISFHDYKNDLQVKLMKWKNPKRTVFFARRCSFLDLGNKLFRILKWKGSPSDMSECFPLFDVDECFGMFIRTEDFIDLILR